MRVYRELNCRLLLPIIKLYFTIISLLTPLTVSWRCCLECAKARCAGAEARRCPGQSARGHQKWRARVAPDTLLLTSHRPGVGTVLLKPQRGHAVLHTQDPKRASFRSCYFSLLFLTSCRNQNASVHCCRVKEGCLHVDGILQIEKIF